MDSSPDSNGRPALPVELHAATREKHHALNTSIMARLPLCLPPSTNTPLLYAKGMTVYGQIYFAFEQFLESSLASANQDPRLRDIYQKIYFPSLIRTTRLRHDLDALKSTLDEHLAQEVDQLVKDSQAFFSGVTASLSEKPHVLLSYVWAMYLALFNGGRWIHRQLASAGAEFWGNKTLPLSFWGFEKNDDCGMDGENLKVQFKTAFMEASSLLTDAERDEVIEETKKLFDMCSKMVLYLDNTKSTEPLAQSSDTEPVLSGLSTSTLSMATLWGYVASSFAALRPGYKSAWERRVAMVD
ncbi:hypothetical protein EDD36DRAFT_313071 [Exophiala viscosa]|uniref:Heme oxygenase-like protein n=1 Tax=Exophiala viscosa TaxID=2486360 RepID=A0AAN6DRE5_9EURO|nr:hypothetical protein EDD36DRAFT_313071 [Exophiala viscosa]